MNCARIREQLPSLLDDRLATAAREIRSHVAVCPDCEREFTTLSQTLNALDAMPAPTPSPRLRARVYAAIAAEQHALRNPATAAEPAAPVTPKTSSRPARSLWFWLVQPLAAAALLVLGFTLGNRANPIPAAPLTNPAVTPAATPAASDAATQRELAELRKKVDSMSQLVGYSLLQQQSRSSNERLRGVLTSAAVAQPDDKTINDLIGALALDPSANVRLNALEALYPHADQEVVRAGVLTSLPREQSPIVQISMIDFLVASRDREATPALQKLSANTQADLNVREAAKRALTQL